MKDEVTLLRSGGKGRSFVILHEEGTYLDFASSVYDALCQDSTALLASCDSITHTNWSALTDSLRRLLEREGVRQASFVAFSAAAAVVLHLALKELKLVRAICLVDAATRPHPSLIDRIADKIENFLPLGLPLRSLSQGFDAKSFLQRVRCPVLVVTSSAAGSYTRAQAALFQTELPTGWLQHLSGSDQPAELTRLVREFQKVPAKVPQKNLETQRAKGSAVM